MSDTNRAPQTIILAEAMFTGKSTTELPQPGGVAIDGDTIRAVGSIREIEALAGPGTTVHRYGKDALLMPAICDSHLHLQATIIALTGPQLRYVASEEECVRITKEWADAHPEAEWIVGFGWHFSNWPDKKPPDKTLMSKAIPDRPVCLLDVDFHSAWANQKALDLYGITKDTPEAEGGVIHRYESGEPNGYLEEGPSMDMYTYAAEVSSKDPAVREKQIRETGAKFHAYGTTAIMDAFSTPAAWIDTFDKMSKEGTLPLRIDMTTLMNDNENYLAEGLDLADRYNDPKALLGFWGFKLLADGVGGTRTAWLTEPYADAPDVYGYPLVNPDTMRKWVLEVEKLGYGVHVHSVGNAATKFALDAFAEAKKLGYLRGGKKQRNCITHCDVVLDEDFARFGELSIVASLQPSMLAPQATWANNLHPAHWGEKRMFNAWANRRLFDNAAMASFSSDSPVTVIDPMNNIYAAIERKHRDGTPEGGIHPEQRVTMSECLHAYTYGGAYQLGKEDVLGSLEAGKLADIAVLSRNLFDVDPEQYRGTHSLLTLLGGRVVHQA